MALFCCFSMVANSQIDHPDNNQVQFSRLYFGMGGGGCTQGYSLGLNGSVVFTNSWGMTLGYDYYSFQSVLLPQDYQSGLKFGDPFSGDNLPQDKIHSISFCLDKQFASRYRRLHFGLDFGPTYVNYVQKYYRINPNPGWLGSNYLVNESSESSIGLFLKVKADFAFAKYLGAQLALIANANDTKSYLGWELNLLFGKLM